MFSIIIIIISSRLRVYFCVYKIVYKVFIAFIVYIVYRMAHKNVFIVLIAYKLSFEPFGRVRVHIAYELSFERFGRYRPF